LGSSLVRMENERSGINFPGPIYNDMIILKEYDKKLASRPLKEDW
jgi:hypothetical protein